MMAIERLKELSKHDLVKKAVNGFNTAKKHKETAKRAGMAVLGGVEAAGGGALGALLAMKAERLGNTAIRTDLTVGAGILVIAAAGGWDDATPHASAFAHGLIGAGTKDVGVKMLTSMGMTKTNLLAGK